MPGVRELPPDLAEMAKKTVNEDNGRTASDIGAIKTWLQKQAHLTPCLDDQWILSFLRGSKFSLERTKEKLDMYYTYKSMLPEFYGNRDPLLPELQAILNLGITAALPHPDKLGRQIYVMRCTLTDPKKHNILDIVRASFLTIETAIMEQDRGVIAGDVYILDFKNATLDQMTCMTPSLIKKAVSVVQDGFPIRPQAVHYINTNSFFEATFNIFKAVMKKKLRERLFVHGSDYSKLQHHIPKHLLPLEYGGNLASVDTYAAEWKRKVESYRDWFIADQEYGCDEKKRPGKPKTSSELFGIEGSFRTLNVD